MAFRSSTESSTDSLALPATGAEAARCRFLPPECGDREPADRSESLASEMLEPFRVRRECPMLSGPQPTQSRGHGSPDRRSRRTQPLEPPRPHPKSAVSKSLEA